MTEPTSGATDDATEDHDPDFSDRGDIVDRPPHSDVIRSLPRITATESLVGKWSSARAREGRLDREAAHALKLKAAEAVHRHEQEAAEALHRREQDAADDAARRERDRKDHQLLQRSLIALGLVLVLALAVATTLAASADNDDTRQWAQGVVVALLSGLTGAAAGWFSRGSR